MIGSKKYIPKRRNVQGQGELDYEFGMTDFKRKIAGFALDYLDSLK